MRSSQSGSPLGTRRTNPEVVRSKRSEDCRRDLRNRDRGCHHGRLAWSSPRSCRRHRSVALEGMGRRRLVGDAGSPARPESRGGSTSSGRDRTAQPEQWSNGAMGQWSNGAMGQWNSGCTLVRRSSSTNDAAGPRFENGLRLAKTPFCTAPSESVPTHRCPERRPPTRRLSAVLRARDVSGRVRTSPCRRAPRSERRGGTPRRSQTSSGRDTGVSDRRPS